MPDDEEQPEHGPGSGSDDPDTRPRTFNYRRSFTIGRQPPTDPWTVVIPGRERTFEWRLGGEPPSADEAGPAEPVSYYEALTGKPDPNRGLFITARRTIDILLWAIALGLPLALVGLGVLAGEKLETIVIMGVFGLLIGLLLRSSFPRTRFY